MMMSVYVEVLLNGDDLETPASEWCKQFFYLLNCMMSVKGDIFNIRPQSHRPRDCCQRKMCDPWLVEKRGEDVRGCWLLLCEISWNEGTLFTCLLGCSLGYCIYLYSSISCTEAVNFSAN